MRKTAGTDKSLPDPPVPSASVMKYGTSVACYQSIASPRWHSSRPQGASAVGVFNITSISPQAPLSFGHVGFFFTSQLLIDCLCEFCG